MIHKLRYFIEAIKKIRTLKEIFKTLILCSKTLFRRIFPGASNRIKMTNSLSQWHLRLSTASCRKLENDSVSKSTN